MNLSKTFALLVLILFQVVGLSKAVAQNLNVKEFEHLAIQDGGRVKPFDTFARESVLLITGKQNYQGKNPTELVLSWLFFPQEWSDVKFFQIKHLDLKKDLNMAKEEGYFSPNQIKSNPALAEIFEKLAQLNKEKRKLSPYYQAVQKLGNQVFLFNEIISGHALKLIPQKLSHDWLSVAEIKDYLKNEFNKVSDAYYASIGKNNSTLFIEATKSFKAIAVNEAKVEYPSEGILKLEVAYNKLRPFRLSFLMYLLSGIVFLLSFKKLKQKHFLNYVAYGLLFSGVIIHVFGFAVRCWISGRPPVSNMYESVIWVAIGILFFGGILEYIYKKKYVITISCFVAALCLFVGDSVPMVLDQSIKPLEPVLRSNFWLTTHVLIITISYAAFALAAGIGNYGLWIAGGASRFFRIGRVKLATEDNEKLKTLSLFVYRCLQIGVLLLTAGTILGGVWADYSWGRFWGWDPKETWALIADLAYLAILHGRFTGWLKNFGTLAAAVCCFVTVIMAWYGVNFVLGVGLHSYGFGSGGVQYVAALVAVQLAFVGWAWWKHKNA